MIVVRVELWSAITGRVTEIARMEICNSGTSDSPKRGDYAVRTLRGRSAAQFSKSVVNRAGRVMNHARLSLHVWHLVAKALTAMKYGAPASP